MADVETSRQNVVHDIPDYNTMYNTPSGGTYDYSQNVHPFAPASGNVQFEGGVSPFDTSKPVPATSGVAILPSQPNTETQQPAPRSQDPARRRSSLGGILASVFSGGGSSREGSNKDLDLQRTRSVPASTFSSSSSTRRKSMKDTTYDLGRRRSSAYLSADDVKEGTIHKGPYAHISKAQAEHMERLREAERNLGRTTNIDGLPLPETQPDDKRHRRRSSLANVLGLNKKMLAF
ncbi:hypothetical protein BGZ73_006529 [Actinomortierella ambigua]|nr:hypothetical protein BGZ73_006529 [Actinomortierella ambigua]